MRTNGKRMLPVLGERSLEDWIDQYEHGHQHPVNRVFHLFGIPMIMVSLPLFLLAPVIRGFWKVALFCFTIGWIFQFAGHAIEGKPPEFIKDWRFLLVGTRWWISKIQRQRSSSRDGAFSAE